MCQPDWTFRQLSGQLNLQAHFSHTNLLDICQPDRTSGHMLATLTFWTGVSHIELLDLCQPHRPFGNVSATLNFWIYVTPTNFQTLLNHTENFDTCQPRWTVNIMSARVKLRILVRYTWGLTEEIRNLVYYPQLGILNSQLVIFYPIGDWVFGSLTLRYQPHLSPIPNWIYYP